MTGSAGPPDPLAQAGRRRAAQAGRQLAAEAARFAALGWMPGTSGNLSAVLSRDPLRLAVTGSGLDKGALTPADVVVVDASGQPAAGYPAAAAAPSAEAAFHAWVAGLTGAGAVVHLHTIAAVVASRRWPGGIDVADLEMLKGIGLPAAGQRARLPVITNSQHMAELGDRFERAWQPPVPGVLIAGHGLYAWGPTILKARHHTEIIQWLLEYVIALNGT